MYINTNVAALFAENSLSNTQNTLSSLQQQMSTGYKINSPADNPSGLAIANLMQGEIGGINAAVNNATEASNLLNTANGGMQTDLQIVQQIQQLAVQASNGTNNTQNRQDIQHQITQLLQSLDNVAQTLNYNNQFVLNQGASTSAVSNAVNSAGLAQTTTAAIGATTAGTNNFLVSATDTTVATGSYSVVETYATSAGGPGTVTLKLYSGGTLDGTATFATTATSGSFTTTVDGGLTVGFDLASVVANGTTGATQDLTVATNSVPQLINSVSVGADSGAVAAGTYSVAIYYSSVSGGTDFVTVTDATTGSAVATGSVSNLASLTGSVEMQLVSGNNSTGSDSFTLNVNQGSLVNAASVSGGFGTSSNIVYQTVAVTGATQYKFQTGPNQGNGNTIESQFGTFNSVTLGLNSLDVTQNPQYAVTQAQNALSMLTNAQGGVGAQIDQINYTLTNLQTETTNLQSSRSAIMDANMAKVTSQFAQEQILMQTGIQALQTAQQLPGMVLKLLG